MNTWWILWRMIFTCIPNVGYNLVKMKAQTRVLSRIKIQTEGIHVKWPHHVPIVANPHQFATKIYKPRSVLLVHSLKTLRNTFSLSETKLQTQKTYKSYLFHSCQKHFHFRPFENKGKRNTTMCGGAIISDFIPPTRSRRVTADFLWPNLKKSISGNRFSKPLWDDNNDEFEADFNDFKDDVSDVDDEEEVVVADVKPYAFSAARIPGTILTPLVSWFMI